MAQARRGPAVLLDNPTLGVSSASEMESLSSSEAMRNPPLRDPSRQKSRSFCSSVYSLSTAALGVTLQVKSVQLSTRQDSLEATCFRSALAS